MWLVCKKDSTGHWFVYEYHITEESADSNARRLKAHGIDAIAVELSETMFVIIREAASNAGI